MHDDPPTPSELRALRALVEHGTMARAAAALGTSRQSIDAQLDRLRRRSGLHYVAQLVAWAIWNGWLKKEQEPEKRPDRA